MAEREAWLSGPIEGVPPYLMPAAHALVQVAREARGAAAGLEPGALWARPAGVASVGFHLRHIAGVIDRLLGYARGEPLDAVRLAALQAEAEPGDPPERVEVLLDALDRAVERALAQLRATPPDALLEPRGVGRRQLPSTVIGLLFHAAEHAQRHLGQLLVTARVVGADRPPR